MGEWKGWYVVDSMYLEEFGGKLTIADEPLTCLDPAATCLWDSDATLVSCVTSAGTILPPFSANCVDHSVVPTAANIQQWYVGSQFVFRPSCADMFPPALRQRQFAIPLSSLTPT
jgi:hypothetical protein